MTHPDAAFDRLRAIDPGRPPTARPDVEAFAATLERSDHEIVLDREPRALSSRPTIVLTLAAAVAIGLVVGVVWIAGQRTPSELEPSNIVIDDVPATTSPTTSAATTTTSTSPSTVPARNAIDAETQALLDRVVSTFNAGDVDDFVALLQPGMNREVIVDRDRRLYSLDMVRDIYAIEADLHTTIDLDCEPTTDPTAVTCVPIQYDDLHRILDVPPTEGDAWTFRFDDDGLIRSWTERRENQRGVDDYERLVYRPFDEWAVENHPDTVGPGLKPAVAGE
ncbi:MAG: hypothetical protein HKN41_00825, partial [Ilumatobacter sp.]|nr:hypothetical protein [Ilumatobacter sp.]